MTRPTCLLADFEPRMSCSIVPAVPSHRTSDLAFVGISSLLFAISVVLTITSCASMSAMGGMPMPGGWTMSMMWMRMPGQAWVEAAASFLAMWVVMMTAMMLPSHVPALWRYRQALRSRGESRAGRLTLVAGVGYFFVWALFGLVAFPIGAVLAKVEMQRAVVARAVPVTVGTLILIAGALQFTPWKAHHLARCRNIKVDARTAWRQGMQLGFHCSLSCANLTAILLAVGMMDLRTMTLVTTAITAERLTPSVERVPQAIGAVLIVSGLLLITQVITLR